MFRRLAITPVPEETDTSARPTRPHSVLRAQRHCARQLSPPGHGIKMDNTDFLNQFSSGNASIHVRTPENTTVQFAGLNLHIISQRSPVLGATLERRKTGPRCDIENSSVTAVVGLLRFLYIDNYMPDTQRHAEQSSQLLHAEMYHLGETYGLKKLCDDARYNTLCETELACSLSTPPPDLCAAIRYLYELPNNLGDLKDLIIHYIVRCLHYHQLDSDGAFRQTASDLEHFHQDLQRANNARNFQDDTASAIMRLPSPYTTYEAGLAFKTDLLNEFLADIAGDIAYDGRHSGDGSQTPPTATAPTTPRFSRPLAFRPAAFQTMDNDNAADVRHTQGTSTWSLRPRPAFYPEDGQAPWRREPGIAAAEDDGSGSRRTSGDFSDYLIDDSLERALRSASASGAGGTGGAASSLSYWDILGSGGSDADEDSSDWSTSGVATPSSSSAGSDSDGFEIL